MLLIISILFTVGCVDSKEPEQQTVELNFTLVPEKAQVQEEEIFKIHLMLTNTGNKTINLWKLEEQISYDINFYDQDGTAVPYECGVISRPSLTNEFLVELGPGQSLNATFDSRCWTLSDGKYTLNAIYHTSRGESIAKPYWLGNVESNNVTIEVVKAKQPELIELSMFDDSLISLSTGVEPLGSDYEGPLNMELMGLLASMGQDDLTIRSDTILTGTVKEILPSKWNIPGGWHNDSVRGSEKAMYTDVVINVDQYLKNPLSSDEVIVRIRGGTVEGTTMSADFEPDFTNNEKVLLFLREDPFRLTRDIAPEHFTVTGYVQGKFTLTEDGNAVRWRETVPIGELLDTIETHADTTLKLPEDFVGHMIISLNVNLEKLSYEDLSRESDSILIGEVQKIHPARWNTPDGKIPTGSIDDLQRDDTIYTDITIDVDQYLKNPLPSDEVTVRIEGGAVDNVIVLTDHEPYFTEGEVVLLYLSKNTYPLAKDIAPEHFIVTGYKQGKFTVLDNGKAVGQDETTNLENLLDIIDDSVVEGVTI
ncbi:hypothetical protein J7W08_02485 [Methanococcoides orientis]|uniref:hypothetical protein n=1 Tax=Methanococcoides orientis TaxID=2822137 RepID=UPI001E29B4A1|nr:hypothetical protein [Methanococcoides orientis]UGV41192.1 hypothetical protein J7W08_02485 [Methanococcoides orientis]